MKARLTLLLAALATGVLLALGGAAPALARSNDDEMILVVLAPPAVMTPGSSRTWRFETADTRKGPDGETSDSNTQTIRLTVEAARGDRLVLSYVIVDYSGDDPAGPLFARVTQQHPLRFYADESGLPTGLVDWTGQRAVLAEAYRQAGGENSALVADIIEGLDENRAIQTLIPEVRILADMQSWAPSDLGEQVDEPVRTLGEGDNQVILRSWRRMDPANGGCVVGVTRFTGIDPASRAAKAHGQVDVLKTTGVLSTADGWLVSGEETHDQSREAYSRHRVVKVTRVSAGDDCPTSEAQP